MVAGSDNINHKHRIKIVKNFVECFGFRSNVPKYVGEHGNEGKGERQTVGANAEIMEKVKSSAVKNAKTFGR